MSSQLLGPITRESTVIRCETSQIWVVICPLGGTVGAYEYHEGATVTRYNHTANIPPTYYYYQYYYILYIILLYLVSLLHHIHGQA